MDLPIDEFNAYIVQIIAFLEREAESMGGTMDHRARVEREMRRIHG